MSRRPALLGIVVLVLTALASLAPAAEKPTLRWQLRKGQVLRYLLRHQEVRKVAIADQSFETTTDTEHGWEWTVNEVDDRGAATLAAKLTALRVRTAGKDFDFQYDSARNNEASDDYRKQLLHFHEQLRYAAYQVQLDPTGRARVTGFDKLLGEVTLGMHIADFHALNLRDDSYATYLQMLVGALPTAPSATWKSAIDTRLPNFGSLTGECTYRHTGPVKVGGLSCQEVRWDGALSVDLDMTWIGQPLRGTLRTTKLAGSLQMGDGRVQSSKAELEWTGKPRLGSGDKPAVFDLTFQHTFELQALP